MTPADFDRLYAEHLSGLRRFVRHRLGDVPEVEDVLQEGFLRLALRLEKGVDEHFVPAIWLRIVVGNMCKTIGRHRTRWRSIEFDGAVVAEDGATVDAAELIPAIEGNPERELEIKTMRVRIRDASGRLSQVDRSLLALRELHGLSHRQIGHRLRKSEEATHSAVMRARRRFAAHYRALEASA